MAEKGDNVYKMTNPKRGPFIIINNETVAKKEKREGTEHDVKKLEETFGGTFGFEVVVHNNKKADEIRGIIEKLGDGEYSDCDCFGLAILTHGDQNSDNIVYGCDGGKVNLDKVFEPLKTCKSLVGKPKLILVQAGPLSVDEPDRVGSGGYATDGKQDESRKIPVEADFYYYFALDVPAGRRDWRFAEKGSIFIQTFCEMLQTHSDGRMDFEALKTQANCEILKKSGQMPTSNMTLLSGLFLSAYQKPGLDKKDGNSATGPGLDKKDGNSATGPGLDKKDGNSATGPPPPKKTKTGNEIKCCFS